ncbi:hypothetical protein TanjilG_13359 [Lupinus angustifolius]|uniref:SAM domain-containing protein n=2 Tax=Lupinus angustifolius TaxID=3871 RepID=A0A4P1RVD0_LUPAN|nr:hypothetical protein TanjilG_13359 [Lupinus angustifolius]
MDWFSWLSRTNLDPSLIYDYGLTFARNELQLEDSIYFNNEFLQSMGISVAKHRLEILKLVKKEEAESAKHPNKNLSKVIKKYLRKCMSKFVFREDHNNIKKVIKDIPLPPLLPQVQEPNWHQGKWKETQVVKQQQQQQHHGTEELKDEKPPRVPMYRSRTIALSGPLDHSGMHEKMVSTKALRLSGPLDGKMNEKMKIYTNRSPLISRHVDGRFTATTKSPRFSGPLDAARDQVENRSPRVTRASDATRGEIENPMGSYSPYNKPKADFYSDDDVDHTLWPTLFQDLKPT